MPNAYDFTGRTALVTGGASGIGAAAAARLRASGAEVAVFDREPVEGYVSVTGDISSSADVDAAVQQVERDLGRIDVLVNSAGVSGMSLRTVDVSDDDDDAVVPPPPGGRGGSGATGLEALLLLALWLFAAAAKQQARRRADDRADEVRLGNHRYA